MKLKAALLMIAGVCAILAASPAKAQTILSNIPGSGTYVPATNLSGGSAKAVGLTLGGTDLVFEVMGAILSNTYGSDAFVGGGIYSDAGGNPGVLLASFDAAFVPIMSDNVLVPFTTSTPFTLLAGTSYWFVLDEIFGAPVDWDRDGANTAPSSNGVTWNGYRLTNNGGSSWTVSSVYNSVAIDAAPVPEPTTWALLAAGAGLFLAFSRARR